ATTGGNDTCRHSAAKTKGIAHCDYPIAYAHLGIIGKIHVGELTVSIYLENGQIRTRIRPYEIGSVLSTILQHDNIFVAAFNNVVIRNEITVFGNEEARPLRHRPRSRPAIRASLAARSLTELIKKAPQRMLVGKILHPGHIEEGGNDVSSGLGFTTHPDAHHRRGDNLHDI